MPDQPRLDLILLWHMHQPDYRDPDGGDYALPWTYLHAIKDYTDMAAHLERHPAVRAVVNFVPVLLDQIEDYARQIATRDLHDPLLRLLVHPEPALLGAEERGFAVDACFRSNYTHMVEPFPFYKRLRDLYAVIEGEGEASLSYLSPTYFSDLVTWYHLAWTGETERRRQPFVAELMSKGENFSLADRERLLEVLGRLIADLVPRYRALAARGQVELSTTPQAHPLAPLLLDFASARESVPGAALPRAPCYPGGRERVDRHLSAALVSHAARFGAAPRGVWPAEGAVSNAVLTLLAAQGCAWAASGEAVLAHTLARAGQPYDKARDLFRPWQDGAGVTLFFRDDRLSDLIGFEYAKWQGSDAARNFIGELEAIGRAAPPGETPLVCIMLDGENAWEYYPYNAYYFFEDLYALLEDHPFIRTTTLADSLAAPAQRERMATLPPLCAGSWVYGTLSTWIGDHDKNQAWDLLCAAKQCYDLVMGSDRLDPRERAEAEHRLTVCEGSDWFWWFGDYNPAHAVASFDQLFRRNLKALYRALHLPAPQQLDHALSHGGGAPETGGTMRRSS